MKYINYFDLMLISHDALHLNEINTSRSHFVLTVVSSSKGEKTFVRSKILYCYGRDH